MAFVAAVAVTCMFLGLSIYFDAQGRQILRWLCFALAVGLPWLFGMTLSGGDLDPTEDGDSDN
jgi:hypothetical protein